MTSVSASHIILTPTQPEGSGLLQWESNPGPPHQESHSIRYPLSYCAPCPMAASSKVLGIFENKRGENGQNPSPISLIFILFTLYTSFMYTLVKCKVTAVLVKVAINDHGGRNMATSLKAGQNERFMDFPKNVKMAIAPPVFHQFSFCEVVTLA